MLSGGHGFLLTYNRKEAKVESPLGTLFPEDTAIALAQATTCSYLEYCSGLLPGPVCFSLASPAAGVILLLWGPCPFLTQNPLMGFDLTQSKHHRPWQGSEVFLVASSY